MGRRDLFRTLDLLAGSLSSNFLKKPQYYGRNMRPFCTVNNQQKSENVEKKNSGEDNNNNTNKDNNNTQNNNNNNHGKLSLRQLQRQREADFVREFNEIHNHFFGNLPFRRYAHFDGFSALDRIFNQEFNRIRNQFFLKDNTAENDTKSTETAAAQDKNNSDKSANLESDTKSKAETDQNSKKQSEPQSVAKQNESQSNLDHFFDLNSFFESPRYISDVENIFKKEQQRLQELTKSFEDSFRNQENNPGARTIRRIYRSDPDGEVREFYDSQNPERNYRYERKYDRTTGQSTITRSKGEKMIGQDQQQEANTTNAQAETKTNNNNTTAEAAATATNAQTAQTTETVNTQTSNTTETKSDSTSVSSQDNEKAKKLSLMLKKDYSECLELAKVYQTQSVGQIIDLVLENESKNVQN